MGGGHLAGARTDVRETPRKAYKFGSLYINNQTHCYDVRSPASHRNLIEKAWPEALRSVGARSRETLARLVRDAKLGTAPEEANEVFGGDDGQLQIVPETGERNVWNNFTATPC